MQAWLGHLELPELRWRSHRKDSHGGGASGIYSLVSTQAFLEHVSDMMVRTGARKMQRQGSCSGHAHPLAAEADVTTGGFRPRGSVINSGCRGWSGHPEQELARSGWVT